jgi:hypothetical protein
MASEATHTNTRGPGVQRVSNEEAENEFVTKPATSDPATAAFAALFRHAAAVVLWVAWFVTRSPLEVTPGPVSLFVIAALVFLYIQWVNKPLEEALGPQYARRPHWSAVFVVPTLFAVAMLVRDIILIGRALLAL